MSRPLMQSTNSAESLFEAYTPAHFPPRTTSNAPSSPNRTMRPARSEDDHDLPYYTARHASLTPSMSASNLGHQTGVNEDHSGAKAWQHLQAGNEKLVSSKEKYDFMPADLNCYGPEDDDDFHDPGKPVRSKGPDRRLIDSRKTRSGASLSCLGIMNVFAMIFISCVLVGIFAGLPITEYFMARDLGSVGSFGLLGTNSSGQVPVLPRDLVDATTPDDVKSRKGQDGEDYVLVFSDEFTSDGRTFWPGDDPYWEAPNIHYYGTNDLERYIPDQVTTRDGAMVITLDRAPDVRANGGLDYISSMVTSWNKFCFTGGIMEVNVSLPGDGIIPGFWPAAWTMGNIGRAGHGATTDGTWPYSYEACDVGTMPNQTNFGDESTPAAAATSGNRNGPLSFLPGQKLSACTCPNEDHPGPIMSDGSYRGRAAPELDLLEAQTNRGLGTVSSQSLQLAPFNAEYRLLNGTGGREYFDDAGFSTIENAYRGGVFQQAASGLSVVPPEAFEATNGWATFAIEYKPSNTGEGYVYWLQQNKATWKLTDVALRADPRAEISARPVPNEPMYMLLNFGISNSFGEVDEANLPFPSQYKVDYVRVWQRSGSIDYGCDGIKGEYPTTDYINRHIEAFTNQNLTTWEQYGLQFPKNRLAGGC